jgi:hypothetical protein
MLAKPRHPHPAQLVQRDRERDGALTVRRYIALPESEAQSRGVPRAVPLQRKTRGDREQVSTQRRHKVQEFGSSILVYSRPAHFSAAMAEMPRKIRRRLRTSSAGLPSQLDRMKEGAARAGATVLELSSRDHLSGQGRSDQNKPRGSAEQLKRGIGYQSPDLQRGPACRARRILVAHPNALTLTCLLTFE